MVSFTETATLKIVDQSSAEIKKINAALALLQKTADDLKKGKGGKAANAVVDVKATKDGAKAVKETAKAAADLQRNQRRAATETARAAAVAIRQQREAERAVTANIRRQKELSATQQAVSKAAYDRNSPRRIRREAARDVYDAAYDYGADRPNKRRRPRYGGGAPPPRPPEPPERPRTGYAAARQMIDSRAAAAAARGGGGGGGGIGAGIQVLSSSAHGLAGQFSQLAGMTGRIAAMFGVAGGVAAVAQEGVRAVVSSEDARTRMKQSGFSDDEVNLFTEYARRNQKEFDRVPAADIVNASVEQLNAIKQNNKGLKRGDKNWAEYDTAMARIASNAQTMAITFKDPAKGAEGARQLERVSQIMGQDVDNEKIVAIQQAAMKGIIATGGEMKPEETVRMLQQLGSSIAKTLTPKGLTDLLLVRDDGGKQSTAEFRMSIQDLMRDSLNEDDKESMAKVGLRKKGGGMDPTVVREASEDLVGFVERRIVPILKKAGKENATSAEIAGYLDEKVGFVTPGARGIADIVTSLRSGEFRRQQAAAAGVKTDPHLGDETFRGGSERLRASFDTALARPLDKMGKPFADAVKPFSKAMDQAGEEAEKGEYGAAGATMARATVEMMGGPAGTIAMALAGISAAKTLIDPSSNAFDKGSALLITGSATLLKAAGMMLKASGDKGDPKAEAAASIQQEKLLEDQIAAQEKKVAKLKPNDPTRMKEENDLLYMRQALESARKESKDLQDRVNSMATTAARKEAEDKAALEEKEDKSGLFPAKPTPLTPAQAALKQQDIETDLVRSNDKLAKATADYEKAYSTSQAKPGGKTAAAAQAAQTRLDQERATNATLKEQLKKLQDEKEGKPPKPTASIEPPKTEEKPQQLAELDQSKFNNAFNTAASGVKIQVEEPPLMQVDTSNLPMIKIDTSNLPSSIPISGGGGKPVDKGSVSGTG